MNQNNDMVCALNVGESKTWEITFNGGSSPESWVMKLTTEGIFFNRERFPNATTDDFAKAVMHILEISRKVKF